LPIAVLERVETVRVFWRVPAAFQRFLEERSLKQKLFLLLARRDSERRGWPRTGPTGCGKKIIAKEREALPERGFRRRKKPPEPRHALGELGNAAEDLIPNLRGDAEVVHLGEHVGFDDGDLPG
jgi:hypothetical protein